MKTRVRITRTFLLLPSARGAAAGITFDPASLPAGLPTIAAF